MEDNVLIILEEIISTDCPLGKDLGKTLVKISIFLVLNNLIISFTSSKSINENVSIVNESDTPQVAPPGRADLTEITSPMVGTFYRAAAPGEDPFVEIGNIVKVGQTICILEAMKLMNEIESEFNAEIVEILVENGTPVEFGQVLMRVKQS